MTKGRIEAVYTSWDVLEFLAEEGRSGITDISSAIDVPKSTVHSHLQTLVERGYVIKEDEQYRIGFRILGPGIKARSRNPLYQIARPEMNELAQETGEVSGLLVEENRVGVFLNRARGDRAARLKTFTGQTVHLHTTGLGKAILANLPRERTEEIIDQHGLPASTENTITDEDELFRELEQVREEGIAFEDGEFMRQLRSVATPIIAEEGDVLASVSLAAPKHRMPEERFRETAPDLIRGVANVIELNFTYTLE